MFVIYVGRVKWAVGIMHVNVAIIAFYKQQPIHKSLNRTKVKTEVFSMYFQRLICQNIRLFSLICFLEFIFANTIIVLSTYSTYN